MLFKGAIYTFALLLTSTTALPQAGTCTNNACIAANNHYNDCVANYSDNLKSCLCTVEFISNYGRCVGGRICAWPATLCPDVYCPGTVAGGFDANYFCGLTTTSTMAPGSS
ncbi:hypothetical protein CPB86DRAFT_790718 [Serendipita vermifera]|nr:hypothetical protein CPB86DRAFT_790718 [Serendipita vermifera]